MRKRRSLVEGEEITGELWPSFTDLISTTALILFVLVLMAYVQNLVSSKRLSAYEARITKTERNLERLQARVRSTKAEVAASRRLLRRSELQLAEQQDVIVASKEELSELRERLEGIAVLRVEVLERVKRSIEAELGATASSDGPLVTIGDNGSIVINESLVFEYNSFALKPDAKPLLDNLANGLGSLLADPDVRKNIDAILVQGHTDERGSAPFNRNLSAQRANAVLDYLFQANPVLEHSYGKYFASAAYSEFRPISKDTTEAAYRENRRIEISVVLRDASIRDIIDEYMRGASPRLEPGDTAPTLTPEEAAAPSR